MSQPPSCRQTSTLASGPEASCTGPPEDPGASGAEPSSAPPSPEPDASSDPDASPAVGPDDGDEHAAPRAMQKTTLANRSGFTSERILRSVSGLAVFRSRSSDPCDSDRSPFAKSNLGRPFRHAPRR